MPAAPRISTWVLLFRAARRAASLMGLARSAPTKPAVRAARTFRSTSGPASHPWRARGGWPRGPGCRDDPPAPAGRSGPAGAGRDPGSPAGWWRHGISSHRAPNLQPVGRPRGLPTHLLPTAPPFVPVRDLADDLQKNYACSRRDQQPGYTNQPPAASWRPRVTLAAARSASPDVQPPREARCRGYSHLSIRAHR